MAVRTPTMAASHRDFSKEWRLPLRDSSDRIPPLSQMLLDKTRARRPDVFRPISSVRSNADWRRRVPGDAVGLDGNRFGNVRRSSAITQFVDGRTSAERLQHEFAARSSATDVSVSWLELLEGHAAPSRAAAKDSTRRGSTLLVRNWRSGKR